MDRVVWIEEGCIQCGWCQNLSGEIFQMSETGMFIRAEARHDQALSRNASERSPLTEEVATCVEAILLQFVSDGCPAHVIKLNTEVDLLGIP